MALSKQRLPVEAFPAPTREIAYTNNEKQISTLHNVTDESQYDNSQLKIIPYLQTLSVPQEVPTGKERIFRVEATKYHIVSEVLFR